MAVYQTRKSWN